MINTAGTNTLSASLDKFCTDVLDSSSPMQNYSRNYFQGHARALEKTHPLTRKRMGESRFSALAQVYATHYPPMHWDINRYGESFSEFIRAQAEGPGAHLAAWDALGAIANIEYAMCRVYYAEDGGCGRDRALMLEPPPGLRLDSPDHALQSLHPYSDISVGLQVSETIFIWRPGIRIQVANRLPESDRAQ